MRGGMGASGPHPLFLSPLPRQERNSLELEPARGGGRGGGRGLPPPTACTVGEMPPQTACKVDETPGVGVARAALALASTRLVSHAGGGPTRPANLLVQSNGLPEEKYACSI